MPKNTPSRIIDNRQARAVSFLGGGGTAGGVTDHGTLSGLGDDDHTQYLLANGARALSGSLSVDAGLTIDGVDISAHAANANAHHNQAHAITGSDHTVTGSQYQIVGLTSTNTLGLLTPSSSPGANAIVKTDSSSMVTLVDLTVTSDLFMSGTLDFGTNTIAEDATYLQFAGSKALRFAQNIGNANWTLYNAGGYTTTGSVSITGSAGDLTVGSNVLFVDNSQANVGINMAPDSQFALDINGPARATYWIGPHAIQLSDVTLLCHYDGREKATQGEYNGHMGQVAAYSGGVAVFPGKFGKAVVSAIAGNNYVPNPSFETDTAGWTTFNGLTATRSNEVAFVGDYSLKCVASTSNRGVYLDVTGLTNGLSYNVSGYVWVRSGTGVTIQLYNSGGSTNPSSGTTISTRGRWVRWSISRVVAGGGIRIWMRDNSGASTWYLDAVQIVGTGYLQPYVDGSLGNGTATDYTWSGTAHSSTSYRYETQLRYDKANVPALDGPGSIAAWAWTDGNTAADRMIVERHSGAGDIELFVNTSGNIQLNFCGVTITGGTFTERQWNYVVATWDGANAKLYLNGAQTGSTTGYTPGINTAATISVGCATLSPYRQLNGMIDDLCIVGNEMAAALVRSIYESNAPVFAEFSRYNFRATPKGLIWADDEGLWMRDTVGKPVLGVYGGETATKNWGGFNLVPGDLLLGNNAVGSSAIWWSRVSGKFGFYGAGSGTPQVEIATDGTLYAGTAGAQRVQLSAAELAGYNSSNQKQWYGSTADGKFYSASGKTWLDKNGLSILAPAAADLGVENYIGWAAQGNLTQLAGYITCGFTSSSANPSGELYVVANTGGGTSRITLSAAVLRLGGLTTSAAAVGTYSGKMKVTLNGTDVWIPYHAS